MFCTNCGAKLPENAKFCTVCGSQQQPVSQGPPAQDSQRSTTSTLVGYSSRINDPAFDRYIKNSKRWIRIFSFALAAIAIVGFYLAGESRADGLSNPESLFIGLGIGGMFLFIGIVLSFEKGRGKDFDGVVEDKYVREKVKKNKTEDGVEYEKYLEFTIAIRSDDGKLHKIVVRDDDTEYNYYKVGERLRYHGKLKSYEKYDKRGDEIIFCSACATLCDINDDVCFRCKCPLLK